jgi:hypothetical protein
MGPAVMVNLAPATRLAGAFRHHSSNLVKPNRLVDFRALDRGWKVTSPPSSPPRPARAELPRHDAFHGVMTGQSGNIENGAALPIVTTATNRRARLNTAAASPAPVAWRYSPQSVALRLSSADWLRCEAETDYSCTPFAAIRRVPIPYFLMFSLTKAPAGPCHHFCSASMLSN